MKKVAALAILLLLTHESLWAFDLPFFSRKKEAVAVIPKDAPLSLEEAYALALKRSEDVKMKKEDLEAAKGRFYQAFNYFLPSVSYSITRKEQDAPSLNDSAEDGVNGTFVRRRTPEQKFVFTQPIFSGFAELAAIQSSGADKARVKQEIRRAIETLAINVVESFYMLLETQKDLEILKRIQTLLKDRLEDLSKRIELGRSRESEAKTSLADLKLVEAELAEAEGAYMIAKRLFEFYIGQELTRPLVDSTVLEEKFLDLSSYTALTKNRADVQVARETTILADKNVLKARSGLFPTADLTGNYYTERVGFQSDIDWDVLLSVNVPIFDGAETLGKVKEAAARHASSDLQYQKTIREAQFEIEEAYTLLLTARAREAALKEATQASEENYAILKDEYSRNLINNLEALDALRRLQDISRSYNSVSQDAKAKYWKFKIAVGELELLDPAQDKKVRT